MTLEKNIMLLRNLIKKN